MRHMNPNRTQLLSPSQAIYTLDFQECTYAGTRGKWLVSWCAWRHHPKKIPRSCWPQDSLPQRPHYTVRKQALLADSGNHVAVSSRKEFRELLDQIIYELVFGGAGLPSSVKRRLDLGTIRIPIDDNTKLTVQVGGWGLGTWLWGDSGGGFVGQW